MSEELPFELRALTGAINYQRWIRDAVAPYLGSRVLEVGAGIGNMSRWFVDRERLVVTEADPKLLELLSREPSLQGKASVLVRGFDLSSDDPSVLKALSGENLDTILSFNVLEHIEDDVVALRRLKSILLGGKGGYPRRIVSFVPAQQWAYGELDRVFGHFRRYTRADWHRLHQAVAPEAKLTFRYFNALGLVGWFVNGRLLRKTKIDDGALKVFEALCPYVRPVDRVLHQTLRLPTGQSLIAVLEWSA